MWEVDHKEGWASKNWCFWTVVLEKTLDGPLDCKEIKPVNPKGNQSWIFIRGTDPETEAPVLWPPDSKNWLIRKDPDAGKNWRQEEKGTTEDVMIEWPHRLNGHGFQQTRGDGERQGSLACCSPWITKSQTRLSYRKTTTFMVQRWPLSILWHLILQHIGKAGMNKYAHMPGKKSKPRDVKVLPKIGKNLG